MKTIWPCFAIQRHKKHKGTKHSFHYIFKEYHGSDPQLCHGYLGSQMTQKNKNVFKPIFDIKGCTFETVKETFVHIHQTRVTGIRTVALIKEEEGGVKPRKTEVNIKRKWGLGINPPIPLGQLLQTRTQSLFIYPRALQSSLQSPIFSHPKNA